MKRTQEIIGLPIISISDGQEVGKVKGVIVNAEKGAIDYIVVDSGIHILSPRVISTNTILGTGEYAVTIENESSINDISRIPAAIDLLQKNIQVKGAKVLTRKGKLIGEIGDFYVDVDTCLIVGLEYIADITQKRIRIIPRDSVITLGKNLIVVVEEVMSNLVDKIEQLGSVPAVSIIPDFEKKNTAIELNILQNEAAEENIQQAVSFFQEASASQETDAGSAQPNGEDKDNAAELFEQRQRQYLNGRKATRTIIDNAGNIIISDGMVITNEVIDRAKASGKLIELVMNNRA